jgi:RHS repeat-associated protein
VVTDRKLPFDGVPDANNNPIAGTPDGNVDFYFADVVSYSDYYPFGMLMPGRHESAGDYRYGFQGQEMDDEVKGEGNNIGYEARMYDPRVGRWMSTDAFESKHPDQSPYNFAVNSPIIFIDSDGNDIVPATNVTYTHTANPVFYKDLGETNFDLSRSFTFSWNASSNEYDLSVPIYIKYTPAFNNPGDNGLNLEEENPRLFLAVSTHEHVHEQQRVNTIKTINVSVNYTVPGGIVKTYSGRADQVLTDMRVDYLNQRATDKIAHMASAQSSIESSITLESVELELRAHINGPVPEAEVINARQKKIQSELVNSEAAFDSQTNAGLSNLETNAGNLILQDVYRQAGTTFNTLYPDQEEHAITETINTLGDTNPSVGYQNGTKIPMNQGVNLTP